jgi:hypothetical protein
VAVQPSNFKSNEQLGNGNIVTTVPLRDLQAETPECWHAQWAQHPTKSQWVSQQQVNRDARWQTNSEFSIRTPLPCAGQASRIMCMKTCNKISKQFVMYPNIKCAMCCQT